MSDEGYPEVDPDVEAAAQAGAERRANQEGADLEEAGDPSQHRSPEVSGTPVDVEQEVRRLRGY